MRKQQKLKSGELDATIVLGANEARSSDAAPAFSDAEKARMEVPGFTDRYRFICQFGAGGVGVVSKARDLMFDRVVAVKALNDQTKKLPDQVDAFLRESRLNAQLDHPSIVPVYGIGRDQNGDWQCVMKFINGMSLTRFIDTIRKTYDSRKISPSQEHHALASRLEYFLKICETVDYCHSMNIVHGDIKPDNILLGKFGEVYLMDWGCACEAGTRPAHISGTPNYLPPEYLKTGVVSKGNDIFALGMILFELTTLCPGRQVCSGSMSGDCSCRLVYDLKNYLHYRPELMICRRMKAIICRTLNPDPGQRYPEVKDLIADIRHFIYDEEVSAAPDNLLQKISRLLYLHRLKTAVAVSLLVLLSGAVIFGAFYRAASIERHHTSDLLRRMRLQSYTDSLAGRVNRNFLHLQTQLQVFADNLLEAAARRTGGSTPSGESASVRYRRPGPFPPGTVTDSPYYPHPVNVSRMTRDNPENDASPVPVTPDHYVEICRKVLSYDPDKKFFDPAHDGAADLLTERGAVQRLLVHWNNGTQDAYPASYDDSASEAYSHRWGNVPDKLSSPNWMPPYRGNTGTHRMLCRYPLTDRAGASLGTAMLEVRLEKLLAPLFRANSADPVHELFFVDTDGVAIALRNGKFHVLSGAPEDNLPSKTEIQSLLNTLKRHHMEQQLISVRGVPYYVSAAMIPAAKGVLLQMISVEAMKNHNHIVAM